MMARDDYGFGSTFRARGRNGNRRSGPSGLRHRRVGPGDAGPSTSPRSAAVVLFGIVLVGALAFAMPKVASMTVRPPATHYVEVTVAPGQTLWDIAAAYKPRRTDTRSMVYRIRDANDLQDASVRPGQVLRVPVRPGEAPAG